MDDLYLSISKRVASLTEDHPKFFESATNDIDRKGLFDFFVECRGMSPMQFQELCNETIHVEPDNITRIESVEQLLHGIGMICVARNQHWTPSQVNAHLRLTRIVSLAGARLFASFDAIRIGDDYLNARQHMIPAFDGVKNAGYLQLIMSTDVISLHPFIEGTMTIAVLLLLGKSPHPSDCLTMLSHVHEIASFLHHSFNPHERIATGEQSAFSSYLKHCEDRLELFTWSTRGENINWDVARGYIPAPSVDARFELLTLAQVAEKIKEVSPSAKCELPLIEYAVAPKDL